MHPFEATNKKIVCPQINIPLFGSSSLSMQENCLIANVLMPDTEQTNLPVLVYVHGGGYQGGWGDLVRPKTLVKSKRIVAVTFNYRLGAHGFLCLGTETAPGNAGMKDQVALLRWVKKNIANFGGNPDDVTIAGGSAGSSAVDLLMLSKMTDGLYNKVIPESGASVGVWSIQHDPIQIAKYFARNNNLSDIDNIVVLEEFYKTLPYDVLMSDLFLDRPDLSFLFVPCIENKIGLGTFLEEAPVDIFKKGKYRKVPVLYGFANMEGMIKLHKFDEWKDLMNENFSNFLPIDLKFTSDEERSKVAKDIKKFYFGDNPIGEDYIQGFVNYYSDVMFTYPHLRSAKLQAAAGSDSIYLYEFSFHLTLPEELGLPKYTSKIRGANHGSQSLVVHDISLEFIKEDESVTYLKLKETMQEMWLNFVTTG